MAQVAVITWGTRGDVSPFVAVALTLQARGHDVVVAAPEDHVRFVESCGLRCHPLAGNSASILASAEARDWIAGGGSLAMLRQLNTFVRRLAPQVLRQIDDVVGVGVDGTGVDGVDGTGRKADVIVCGLLTADLCRIVGEQHGIPIVIGHACPALPSSSLQNALIDRALPRALHKVTSRVLWRVIWAALGDIINSERRRRRLPRVAQTAITWQQHHGGCSLHLWSPALVPRPADWTGNDVVTGFCPLPVQARAQLGETAALAALDDFLASGDAPLFIGTGSMPVANERGLVQTIVAASTQLSRRVLLGGTWSDPAAIQALLPSSMQLCGAVDHDVLFRRCVGVMHHGGAGSTATSLRAGVPTMVTAVLGDQAFWGRRVVDLGVGSFVRFRDLDVETLTRGLATLLDPDVVRRARALALSMADDDGPSAAADAIEGVVA